AIAAKPADSNARDCPYHSRGGVHPPYPVIHGIRDVEIAVDVDSNCRRIIQAGAGGRSTISGIFAPANQYAKRAGRTGSRAGYGINDSSRGGHFANAGVLEIRDISVSGAIYCARDRIPEMSVDGQPFVAAEACSEFSGYRADGTGVSRYFSNPRPATAEIDVSCTVDGDTRWSGKTAMSRWPSVATVCGRARTCDSRDDPG